MRRPLILASGSPQRRTLLKKLRRPFKIVPSHVSERSSEKNPRKLVTLLAVRKAKSVAKKHPEAVVLGADTLVVCKGKIIGKPEDAAHSLRILRLLNGRWQQVYTGLAVALDGGKVCLTGAVKSRVLARKLGDAQLATLAGKHMDKAGAYAVQDKDDPFICRVDGDLDNVIGLPVRDAGKLIQAAERPAQPHERVSRVRRTQRRRSRRDA